MDADPQPTSTALIPVADHALLDVVIHNAVDDGEVVVGYAVDPTVALTLIHGFLDKVETDMRSLDGPAAAFYLAIKGSVGTFFPFLRANINGILKSMGADPLPPKPRHTDAIFFLLRELTPRAILWLVGKPLHLHANEDGVIEGVVDGTLDESD